MTIQFYCPNCDALIAFNNKHTGKRARCLTCGQIFIIPAKDNEKPKKIKPQPEITKPIPGFYRAVFLDSWKIFINPENATSLVFVTVAVCFQFFLAKSVCCLNYIAFIVVWGWLLGFYLNIIYETAFGIDTLPQIYLGTSITFLWYIIKPFLVFFFTMAIVQLPFIISLKLLADKGLTYENMWEAYSGFHLLLQSLLIFGLFLFPMVILTTAVGRSFALLRPDYILAPIYKAFMPYITVVALLVAACVLEMQTSRFDHSTFTITTRQLIPNLAVQIVAITAMRSIGLFYRHFCCYLRW